MSDGHCSKRGAHVIVVGNEKGGSGKTTVAMHLAVGLLRLGLRPRVQSRFRLPHSTEGCS